MIFLTIEDFYDNISRGGEIEFIYKGKKYSITHYNGKISVMEFYNYSTESIYKKAKEVGDYLINGIRLKDIFNEITVTFRCF